ncbi:MAG: hypothetical protein ACLTSL_16815 [Odoribacter splanchnicus]
MNGYDGLVYRFLGCIEFFRILLWLRSEKNFKKTIKIFGVDEKVLTFAAAFLRGADVLRHFGRMHFHLYWQNPGEAFFYGASEKKV